MKLLTERDLLSLEEYERVRQEFRQRIIRLKERRRISVGALVSLVFENRETLLFQVQEMIRAEHLVNPERMRDEVEIYNQQIPGRDQLSATLLIEITDQTQVKPVLDRFLGIDRGQTIGLRVGPHLVYAEMEEGRSREDKISAVHYLRFQIPEVVKSQMPDLRVPMEILIDHPGYRAQAPVPDVMRLAMLEDLDSD